MARKRRRKQKTSSKKYVVWSSVLAGAVTLYAMVFTPMVGDMTMLCYLIPASYGNLATALGFYFEKSKKENTKGGIIYETAMLDNDEYSLG